MRIGGGSSSESLSILNSSVWRHSDIPANFDRAVLAHQCRLSEQRRGAQQRSPPGARKSHVPPPEVSVRLFPKPSTPRGCLRNDPTAPPDAPEEDVGGDSCACDECFDERPSNLPPRRGRRSSSVSSELGGAVHGSEDGSEEGARSRRGSMVSCDSRRSSLRRSSFLLHVSSAGEVGRLSPRAAGSLISGTLDNSGPKVAAVAPVSRRNEELRMLAANRWRRACLALGGGGRISLRGEGATPSWGGIGGRMGRTCSPR